MNLFNPTITQADIDAVINTLKSGWLGKGPLVAEFEAAWARHIKADPANVVSTTSATEALFTAVKLLGIGPGDEVIIPTIHFVGAAQAVLAAGAKPVFCDVDSRTLNVGLNIIRQITQASGGKAAAVILNHYGGVPCTELERIRDWCIFKGLWLIEDAANAPASTYNGQPVGTFGDIGVWSFDAMKIITTGDGGMMYIRDPELAARARQWLYLGTSSESGLSSNEARWWEFEVTQPGARRAVMNDIAAAMGLEQLSRLGEFVERRKWISEFYDEADRDAVSFIMRHPKNATSSYYFHWIQTPRRDELARYLREAGIYTSFRYYPLHLAYKTGDSLPNAERAARETLLLPLHCNLSDEDVEYICGKVREFFG